MDNEGFQRDHENEGGESKDEKVHHSHNFFHLKLHQNSEHQVTELAPGTKTDEEHVDKNHRHSRRFLNVMHRHHSDEHLVSRDGQHDDKHPHGHRHSHHFFHFKHQHGDEDLVHVTGDHSPGEEHDDRKGSGGHSHYFHFRRHHSQNHSNPGSDSVEVNTPVDTTLHGRKDLMEAFYHLIPPPTMPHKQRLSAPDFHELQKESGFEWPPPSSSNRLHEGSDDENDDLTCGVGKWRPKCLQRFATPWSFVAAYGASTVLQGMYFTYFLSVITTIENRFEISSQTTGVVMSGNEVSEILFALLLTYYGGRGHRPHWISWGIWSTAVASFIMASPHFFLSAFTSSQRGSSDVADLVSLALNATDPFTTPSGPHPGSICLASEVNVSTMAYWKGFKKFGGDCSSFGNNTMRGLILIFLSFFVAGLGIAVVQPLGLSYYDDNVPPSQAPMFHGVLSVAKVLGPFLGYIVGSSCLRLYETPWNRPPGMKLEDPRWIGAWWLGFMLIGFGLIIPGFITFLFPRTMRISPTDLLERARLQRMTSQVRRQTDRRNTIGGTIATDKELAAIQHRLSFFSVAGLGAQPANETIPSLKEIYAAVKRLLTNRLFMCHLVALNFQLLANVGFFTFSPKYLESQFRVSAATSNLAVGVAGVLVMAVGMLLAGIFIRKFQPRPRVLTAYHIGVTACCIAGLLTASTIGCNSLSHFGDKDETTGLLNMTNQCNTDCHCSLTEHNVVCLEELGMHFYNPCYAGCTGEKKVEKIGLDGSVSNKTAYTGCSCGSAAAGEAFAEDPERFQNVSLAKGNEPEWTFTSGYCREAICSNFIYYLLMLASVKVIASTARVGNLMITVRSVEKQDKSIAVGLTLVIFSLFGFIPTPIIYGALIDSTCLIWSTTGCGSRGNCALYDTARFRTLLHMTPAALMMVSLFIDVVVWYFSSSLDLYQKDSGVEPHHDKKQIRNVSD